MLKIDITKSPEPKQEILAITAVKHYCRYVTIAVQCVEFDILLRHGHCTSSLAI